MAFAVCFLGGAGLAGPPRPGAGEPGDDCARCHADQTGGIEKGMHPVAGAAGGPSVVKSATCSSCHSTHAAGREPPKADTNADNEPCLACHAQSHPEFFAPKRVTPHNALDCLGCHAMHKADGPRHLTNAPLADGTFCLGCHDDHDSVVGGLHDLRGSAPSAVNARGWTALTGGPCSACHNIHSEARASALGPADPGTAGCVGCHTHGGTGPKVAYQPHPTLPMSSAWDGDDPSSMPLVGSDGKPGPEGVIACLTCHLPHGRAPTGAGQGSAPQGPDLTMLRAQRIMVRPYTAPTLCTSCHGFDGLSRFLRFHGRPGKPNP